MGNNLRQLRQEAKLSQAKFALMIGLDRSNYSEIESGIGNVTIDTLEKIAEGLQVSLSDLLRDVGAQYNDHDEPGQNNGSENGWISL